MRKIWSNKYISLSAEVEGRRIQTHSSELEVTFSDENLENVALRFFESGYSVLEYGNTTYSFIVNEFNLTNLILNELFEQVLSKQKDTSHIVVSEKLADYLISTSKTDEWVFYENGMYFIPANKNYYIQRIRSYNDKINSKDAILANNMLIEIVEQCGDKESKNLVGCDLRFSGLTDGDKYNPKDIVLEDAVAIYTCGRRKVAGLIKHTLNKLNKTERESYDYKLEQLYKYIKEQCPYDVSLQKGEYVEIFNVIPYRINFLPNDNVRVSWKEIDGSIKSIKNVKANASAILQIVYTNENR